MSARAVWYWRTTKDHHPARHIEGRRRQPWKETRRAIWRTLVRRFVQKEQA